MRLCQLRCRTSVTDCGGRSPLRQSRAGGARPALAQLPPGLLEPAASSPAAKAAAFRRFCCDVIDVVAPLVPAVKPQAAFFEQLGPAGMQALAEVIQHARREGLLVILDGKRNDIGSTAEAYAEAYLAPADNRRLGLRRPHGQPLPGRRQPEPFVAASRACGNGIFVLVKTSNPGGGTFQDLPCDGRPLYRHVGDLVERLAAQTAGTAGYGAVGAVVGATYPEQLAELRAAMPHAWILIPGFGSQGGTAADVAAGFHPSGLGAIVNNSRGIIFAHARKEYAGRFGTRWQSAVEAATRDMIAALESETPARQL